MSKKKIGILTFHWSDNYGAVLQAFALQKFISLRGFDCEIIDYLPPAKSIFKKIISRSPGKQLEKLGLYAKHLAFQEFRNNNLVLSEKAFRSLDLLDNAFVSQYSGIIVGSDQVWNPTFYTSVEDFFKVYMLSFANNVVKVSYAASIGHDSIDTIRDDARRYFEELIPSFDYISVRERSSINLLRT